MTSALVVLTETACRGAGGTRDAGELYFVGSFVDGTISLEVLTLPGSVNGGGGPESRNRR